MDIKEAKQIKRDLNPHRPALMAMVLWGAEYAYGGLGVMEFYDNLPDSRKDLARNWVKRIIEARPEG